jgi:arylsulfatase A
VKYFFILILSLLAPLAALRAADSHPPAIPNLIVILADDLGYGDIGPFGATKQRTPQLDRLAREGMKLTSFYAAPCCSPARAALLTGCYARRVGLNQAPSGYWVILPRETIGLNPAETTIADVLRAQGYATKIIGKWHLGDQPEFLPLNHGFDEFLGLPYSNDMWPAFDEGTDAAAVERRKKFNHPPLPLLRNDRVLRAVDDQSVLTAEFTREAVEFIHRNKARPFFLYLPHIAVHVPHHPGTAFQGQSANGTYGDWIEELDGSVGQILRAVRESGLDNNTLIVFTSDNGATTNHGSSNGPLRGRKGTVLEGGIRVPCLARWPGRIPAGAVCDEPAGLIDLLPTAAAISGAALPPDRVLDGRDIEPLLARQPGARSPHEALFVFNRDTIAAVRSANWKLHTQTGELYDLATDIGETTNLAPNHPDIVQRLRSLVAAALEDLGDDSGQHPGRRARPPGRVENPRFIISHDGTIR